MPNPVLLNNIDHADLRIVTERSPALGDAVMSAPCFPFEFRRVQAHYPILFQQTAGSDEVQAVALFGFERGENLFLTDAGWDRIYLPASIERQPFFIGFQRAPEGGEPQRVIHIDQDSPRLSRDRGEAVFLAYGGNSPFLDRMAALLEALHMGIGEMRGLSEMLREMDLLESLAVDIELDDGSKNRLVGFQTINEDRLARPGAGELQRLHEAGHLLSVFMAVASLSQIKPLIDRKNAKVRKGRVG